MWVSLFLSYFEVVEHLGFVDSCFSSTSGIFLANISSNYFLTPFLLSTLGAPVGFVNFSLVTFVSLLLHDFNCPVFKFAYSFFCLFKSGENASSEYFNYSVIQLQNLFGSFDNFYLFIAFCSFYSYIIFSIPFGFFVHVFPQLFQHS